MGGQCARRQSGNPDVCRAGAQHDAELCGKLGQDELSERCAEDSCHAHDVCNGGRQVDYELHHRSGCVDLYSLVEGYLSGAGEEDGRCCLQTGGGKSSAGSGQQHQPDFLGLYHRQDHRLCDHRRLVLHLHDAHEDAVYGADCDDCRRDERHSGVRSVHRRGAECADHSAGRPAAGVLLHCSAAGGRQRHWSQDPRQHRRHLWLLGAHFDHGCGRHLRLRGDAAGRAGICGDLSHHQRYCELRAAQEAEDNRYRRVL